MKSGSNLERGIASGKPAVTAELGPPMSADPHEVVEKAHKLRGFCDAANITDCQTAVVRISSIAAAFIALREGLEPVMQMTCRDRNRIAMQADFRPYNLKKKVDAGADFIQTQGIYDVEIFKSQMEKARNLGLHERTAILGGIIVPRSAMMLKYMDASVAGVTVPKALIDRMNKAKEAAGDDKKKMRELQEAEGLKITVELIHQILEIPGVKGVHIQAIEWESAIEGIVKAAGLYPRP